MWEMEAIIKDEFQEKQAVVYGWNKEQALETAKVWMFVSIHMWRPNSQWWYEETSLEANSTARGINKFGLN